MQMAICQICKYPVWSFICPDCIAKEIGRWLPRGLSSEFRGFSRSLLRHFESFESSLTKVRCLKCRSLKEADLCSFCYIAEIFSWLQAKNRELAKTVFMALPVDVGSGISTKANGTRAITAISFEESLTDEGICEECEEFSERTSMINGRWVCEACKDYE